MNRSVKIYLTLNNTKIATFTYDGLNELAQLLAPVLTDDAANGQATTGGLRVAIGNTQKQATDEMLTIVSPTRGLTWHKGEPFEGSYDTIYYALVAGIKKAIIAYQITRAVK